MLYVMPVLIAIVFGLCLSQTTRERQKAAVIYGYACIGHYMFFELMYAFKIDFPWYMYYISAGFLSALIVERLQSLETYTQFHERLQFIAILSILINGVFGLINFIEIEFDYYPAFSVALYLYLIKELLTNGMVQRVPRNSGFYMRLRRIFY